MIDDGANIKAWRLLTNMRWKSPCQPAFSIWKLPRYISSAAQEKNGVGCSRARQMHQ